MRLSVASLRRMIKGQLQIEVATNLALDLPALYAFICGRGAQEKTIAELKGEFAGECPESDTSRPGYYCLSHPNTESSRKFETF